MSSELERRTAIIVALRCSRAPKEIIDFFKFPKDTVYSIAKSFKESEDIEERFITTEERLQTDLCKTGPKRTSTCSGQRSYGPPAALTSTPATTTCGRP
ncbi:Transposable element tcb2 transposase [Caligus rogercresseyi]|uniref:Transposable element tcb2 transposase n=1 Tax=Caligus rogercresseyi TaxID=217165 RepID=A0A7T8GQU9_CALRO|nr:Transposable element tcb2 transposase [Caligus rogercresseyi]